MPAESRKSVLLLLVVAAAASGLRLPRLHQRPMHGDEAIHTVRCDELWERGRFEYDPQDYHGPTLYYFTLPVLWLSGARDYTQTQEWMYRIVPVVFGVAMILLLPLVSDGLGRVSIVLSAVLFAVSPAMVFYSRYYIQEMLLASFTLAAIAAGWRFVRTRRTGWALLAGVCIGLMHATKETCIIALAAAIPACAVARYWPGRAGEEPAAPVSAVRRGRSFTGGLAIALAAAAVVSVTAFSVFFRNWRGPLDSVLCFVNYAGRAAHYPDHIHPWYYYAGLLAFTNYHGAPVWSEAFILALAAIGAGFALFGGSRRPDAEPRFVRFLAVYSLLLAVAYSAVPYKTPWCTVQMLTPLILLAGYGATELFARAGQNRWWRLVAAGVGLAGIAHLGWQAYAASYRFPADNRNPYVYGHALRGVIDAVNWIERVAAIQPDGRKLLTQVIAGDPWPLPWYLRGFERVGYWEQPPDDLAGDVLIVDTRLLPRIEARLGDDFQVSFYGLRPGETIGVCVRRGLYDRFVESQTRERSR